MQLKDTPHTLFSNIANCACECQPSSIDFKRQKSSKLYRSIRCIGTLLFLTILSLFFAFRVSRYSSQFITGNVLIFSHLCQIICKSWSAWGDLAVVLEGYRKTNTNTDRQKEKWTDANEWPTAVQAMCQHDSPCHMERRWAGSTNTKFAPPKTIPKVIAKVWILLKGSLLRICYQIVMFLFRSQTIFESDFGDFLELKGSQNLPKFSHFDNFAKFDARKFHQLKATQPCVHCQHKRLKVVKNFRSEYF